MNYIDITLCIPLVWGLYKGFMKGLIVEAASFIAFSLAVYGGLHFSDFIADLLHEELGWQSDYLPIVSFAITFLGIVISVYLIAKLVQRLVEGMALGGINKIGGALLGSLKYALIMSLIIFIIDAFEKSYSFFSLDTKKESILYEPIGTIAPLLIPGLRENNFSTLFPEPNALETEDSSKTK